MDNFIIAARDGKLETVKALLPTVNINARHSTLGITALIQAAHNNRLDVVEFLLNNGADTEMGCIASQRTALHYVANFGHLGSAELLLAYGANIQAKDAGGNTPLHIAAFYGSENCVTFFLDHGADHTALNNDRDTPSTIAAKATPPRPNMSLFIATYKQTLKLKLLKKQLDTKFSEYKKENAKPLNNFYLASIKADVISSSQQLQQTWLVFQSTEEQEAVRDAVKLSLKDLKDEPINTLLLNFQIIKHLSTSINQVSSSSQNGLIRHMNKLVKQHRLEIESLYKIANNKNSLSMSIDSLAGQLFQAENAISQFSSNKVLALPTGLEEGITQLSKALNQEGMVSLLQDSYTSTNHIINAVDGTLTTIQQLKDSLNRFLANPITNSQNIIDTQFKLGLAQIDLKQQVSTLQNTLGNIGQGIQMAGQLANLVGAPPSVQKIVTVAMAGMDIVKNLTSFGALAAMSGPAAPVVAIAGAVTTILGALGIFGGPNQEEEMLQQISEQISQLAKHVDVRFDQLEKMLGVIHEQMHLRFDRLEAIMNERFDRIEDVLLAFHKDVQQDLASIQNDVNTIQRTGRLTLVGIGKLSSMVDKGFREITERKYTKLKESALTLNNTYPNQEVRQTRANEYSLKLKLWATEHASKPSLAGNVYSHEAQLCEDIIQKGIAYNINLIAAYLDKLNYFILKDNKIQVPSTALSNPIVWADAANTYMRMLNKTKGISPRLDYISQIDSMIMAGKELNQFFQAIQTSSQLFVVLCNKYQKAVLAALGVFNAHTLKTPIANNSNLSQALDEVDNTYKLLVIFSTMAYGSINLQASTLGNHLQLRLWSKDDIQHYLSNTHNDARREVLTEGIEENVTRATENLMQHLLSQTAEAQYMYAHHKEIACPMINAVIEELEAFKVTRELYEINQISIAEPMQQKDSDEIWTNEHILRQIDSNATAEQIIGEFLDNINCLPKSIKSIVTGRLLNYEGKIASIRDKLQPSTQQQRPSSVGNAGMFASTNRAQASNGNNTSTQTPQFQ